MHDSVRAWVADRVAALGLAGRAVLEVGSRDVNGSVRDLFTGPYVGLDVRPGPGVTVVGDITDPGSLPRWPPFGAVVCCEALEHVMRPWAAVARMAALTAPQGHFLATCRGYDGRGTWPLHDPPDLWRFSRDGLSGLVLDYFEHAHVTTDPEGPGWFVHAMGPRSLADRGATP